MEECPGQPIADGHPCLCARFQEQMSCKPHAIAAASNKGKWRRELGVSIAGKHDRVAAGVRSLALVVLPVLELSREAVIDKRADAAFACPDGLMNLEQV